MAIAAAKLAGRSVTSGSEIPVNIGSCSESGHPSTYETNACRYLVYDLESHMDLVRNLMLRWLPYHLVVLVVSALDGINEQTRQQVRLARIVGVEQLVVFLNKCDLVADGDMVDLADSEILEMLREQGYASVRIVRGSALEQKTSDGHIANPGHRQSSSDLIEAIEHAAQGLSNAAELPFLMEIEDLFSITGRGVVVTGHVYRGTLGTNESVEIVGLRPTRRAVATDLESFGPRVKHANRPGQNGCALLRDLAREDVERGQMVAAPGSIRAFTRVAVELYLCETVLTEIYSFNTVVSSHVIRVRHLEVPGRVVLDTPPDGLRGGDTIVCNVELDRPVALEVGTLISIGERAHPCAFGVVTEVVT